MYHTTVITDTNQVREEDQAGMLSTPLKGIHHFNNSKTDMLSACPKCQMTEMKLLGTTKQLNITMNDYFPWKLKRIN